MRTFAAVLVAVSLGLALGGQGLACLGVLLVALAFDLIATVSE